jgi:hypothetical protein
MRAAVVIKREIKFFLWRNISTRDPAEVHRSHTSRHKHTLSLSLSLSLSLTHIHTNSDYVCLPHTSKIHIIFIFSHLSLVLARGFSFSRLSFSMISRHFVSMCPTIFTIMDYYYYHHNNIPRRAQIISSSLSISLFQPLKVKIVFSTPLLQRL